MSPIPILTRRSTHPYPFSIPARSSSASHLPLSSDQDDDDDDEDLAQAKAHQKAKPRSRRRVSFDLNTILHHPPALQEDEDDIEQEELQDDLPPLRTSSLAFTAQPMASHSSPNLPSMLTFASFGDREAPSRVVSGPVARTRLVSSPPEPSNSKLGRRLGPKILRSPLPAKARVARRTVIAQRHAAALELMLCGATTSASCELESHQHPKAAEPNVAKPRLARRWSLLPRLSSSKSVAKQEPESRDNDTSDPPASDEANTSTDSSTADTQAVPQSRRFGFFQRASPASSTSKPSPAQLSTPSPTKSALTPKQIKTLKAALMDFDLANGIIGELRARSVNPVEILARTDSAAASQGIAEQPERTAVQVEPTRVQPRYVLGPLLPPLETALAAVSVLPSRHERGRSGNGSRDDSALPDPVRTSISEALETVGPQGDATKSDAAQEDNVGQETRQSSSSSATPRMTARLSLANILNRVRSRSVSPSSAATAATASPGVDSHAELLAAAGAATAVVATAVAITAATSSGSEAAKEKASVVILEEPGSAEAKDADTVAPLLPFGMSTALDGIPDAFPKLQPPKIMGMSPISLALSPRQTIVSQVAASSGAFDALADFSAAAIGPDSAALTDPSHAGFPTDRLSFLVHWWGYEILLPPLAMSHLSTAQSISSAFLSFLQTMAISASLPEMLPFIKYISMWVELEFRAIHEQDARGGGKGVVLAATWVMPLALVPRSWDYPVCSPDGSSGPDAVPAPASASGRPLPSVPANTAGATGPALGVGVVPIPEEKDVMPPPPLTKQPRRISLPPTSPNRQLRNRLDGPIVPPKEKRSPFVSSPTPALLPIPVRF
ncbi:hypothetical protein OC845_001556 [Tilletia horrida]|nr:hypothetical protein OC845_001556 [Tilletia horrida]